MRVLHFGKVHDPSCPELEATSDYVPLADISEEAVDRLDLQLCSECLE